MASLYEQLIAETYDAQYAGLRDPSGDRAFYAGLAEQTGGPVLELGCGTGRVLFPIAAAGHTCVGVDPSSAMLAVFAARGIPPTCTLVESTAQALDLERRDFGLATLPFRGFMHLETVHQQLQTLRRIHAHLRPGGLLALDVFDPDLARMATESEVGEQPPFAWRDRSVIRAYSVVRDHSEQVQTVRFDYRDADSSEELGSETLLMRWVYRFELEHLLVRMGFEPLHWYGGFQGQPYDGESGEIIVVARRQG